MENEVTVLAHSSIRITGDQVVYFDPFQVAAATNDADVICITHDHFDHFSPDDIGKVKQNGTVFVCPKGMKEMLLEKGIGEDFIETVEPGDALSINQIELEAVPAYNVGKAFHPKEKNYVGYVLTMNGVRYYVAGDTDQNEDVEKVRCDVALLPVGGKYTCDAKEAARFALALNPKLAIPMHYTPAEGKDNPGTEFAKLLEGKIETKVFF